MKNLTCCRPEYPRPQFVRGEWINLNGEWEYQTDRGESGEARDLTQNGEYTEKILLPFCRESVLSGIGDKDFCECVWYRKRIVIPSNWQKNARTILHVGACDYLTTIWVNGKLVGEHIGGYASFSFDITAMLIEGENAIVIRAIDRTSSNRQPVGKQSQQYHSQGCSYTRTTGIWQTVWLEKVPMNYIKSVKYYTDIDAKKLIIRANVVGGEGLSFKAVASYNGAEEGRGEVLVRGAIATLEVPLQNLYLWEVGNGRLYDLQLSFGEGSNCDKVNSYFGMRSVETIDGFLYLNHKPVFQRLILDQGFYPDGIYTAPNEESLIADIDRALEMGFNGARLHQKVFEPRFLYWCDKKGYIVWGEHASWGLDLSLPEAYENFVPEWCEIIARDFNHPAIIGWCPLNETLPNQNPNFVNFVAMVTRQFDDTRAYIDASGWCHLYGVTDIMDLHDYEQDPVRFAEKLEPLKHGGTYDVRSSLVQEPRWEHPTFVSEYGGIHWSIEEQSGWGYGVAPTTEKEFLDRFKGLTEVILNHPKMGGLCYTQLTDVEQETNGLYTYDRRAKFDPGRIRAVMQQPAAIEEKKEV